MSDLITHLDNGLRVILREVHSAPVISAWVAYKVGSRNERSGQTGISHWVEHMLFKGTDKFPAGMLDREIDRTGGTWNASTSMDYTMYYATLPAERIDIALAAEADRMVNARFDPAEAEAERSVILSERQGSENNPTFWLDEEMLGAAFRVHGYHHTIIGDVVDLKALGVADLKAHYHAHYRPSNATFVAVGAFDKQEMLQKVKRHFAHLSDDPPPQLFVRAEPPQQGERRFTVQRPGTTAFLTVAHHVPAATHPDWFKLEVLDSVLTGQGASIDNKTSRLYKALIKSGIAAEVDGGLAETIDPYIYTINVTLNDGYTHEDAEHVILEEIERLRGEGITEREWQKAIKQARASFAYSTESVTNQAYWLAQSAILGDLNWYDQFLARLEAVTVDDVRDVAQRYLTQRTRITGWLIPTGMEVTT